MTDLELKIIARLRELQNGAKPHTYDYGICRDIEQHLSSYARSILKNTFSAMGLDKSWPIGRYYYAEWSGPRGVERRAFAGRVADFMESKK